MSKSQRSYCFTSTIGEPMFNKDEVRYLVYQKEKGEGGLLHHQGYVEFFRKITIRTAQKILQLPKVHFEIRRGSREEARLYCMKTESRVEDPKEYGDFSSGGQGMRNDITALVKLIKQGKSDFDLLELDPMYIHRYQKFIAKTRALLREERSRKYLTDTYPEDAKLNVMQEELLCKIDAQDDRQITWVADTVGNSGKTWFTRYLVANKNAIRFTNGKCKDIAYAYNFEDTVVFDFSRSLESHINYGIIEDLKNGMLFSTKYESRSLAFRPPKILIMANFEPDYSKFSMDRWDVYIPTG